ncbi:hypothetical protein WJX72_000373 [[Myrmecia] bisecta]|uniref:Uncharacterized protein n=1 Tax=[Myrmecia] bisecta TaxID=41462 RepID=A0AAW1PKR5_9CHLO
MRKVQSAPDLLTIERKKSGALVPRVGGLNGHVHKTPSYDTLAHACKARSESLQQMPRASCHTARQSAMQPVRAVAFGMDYMDSIFRSADELLIESAWSKGLPATECFELYGDAVDSAPPLTDSLATSLADASNTSLPLASSALRAGAPLGPVVGSRSSADKPDFNTVSTAADELPGTAVSRALSDRDLNVKAEAVKAAHGSKPAKQRRAETAGELSERREKLAACLATPMTPDRNQGEEIQAAVRRSAALSEIDVQLRYTREVQQELQWKLVAEEMEESLLEGESLLRRKRRRPVAEDMPAELLDGSLLAGSTMPDCPPCPETQMAMASLSFDDDINKIILDNNSWATHPEAYRFDVQVPDDEALFSMDEAMLQEKHPTAKDIGEIALLEGVHMNDETLLGPDVKEEGLGPADASAPVNGNGQGPQGDGEKRRALLLANNIKPTGKKVFKGGKAPAKGASTAPCNSHNG